MSPSVRGWVQNRFGTADKTLLSTDVYSNQELKRDKVKLERQRKKLESEMDEHRTKYKKLVQQAAGQDEMKKRTLAKKAKFEKKKYKLKEKKHQQASVKFGTILSIEGARDLLKEQEGTPDLTIDGVMENDIEPAEFQAKIEQQMVEFDMEMETMQEVQSSLDFEFMSTDMSMGADADGVIDEINELEQDNIDEDQIDIGDEAEDSSTVSASAEVEVDVEGNDEFDDIELEDEELGL